MFSSSPISLIASRWKSRSIAASEIWSSNLDLNAPIRCSLCNILLALGKANQHHLGGKVLLQQIEPGVETALIWATVEPVVVQQRDELRTAQCAVSALELL